MYAKCAKVDILPTTPRPQIYIYEIRTTPAFILCLIILQAKNDSNIKHLLKSTSGCFMMQYNIYSETCL